MLKFQDQNILDQIPTYIPLILAVFVGGQIGAWLSSKKLNPILLKRITACLILVAAVRLSWGLFAWYECLLPSQSKKAGAHDKGRRELRYLTQL